MKLFTRHLAASLWAISFAVALPACAQERTLPPSTPILPADTTVALRLVGQKEKVRLETVPVTGQEFKVAFRAATLEQTVRDYQVQLSGLISAPVVKGDVLLASFWLRALESKDETGEARTAFTFERAKEPYEKSLSLPVSAGRAWRFWQVPLVARNSYGKGEAQVNFPLGGRPQTLEIGGLSVQNFGTGVKVADLPGTRISYAGREADARWRLEAQKRIEEIRKGDLKVRVVDAQGRPVEGASVQIAMKKHAFGFGTASPASRLVGTTPDDEKYRQVLGQHFNKVVLENDLKWPGWDNVKARESRTLPALNWLKTNGFAARGHVMVWPGWNNLPGRKETDLTKEPKGVRANYESIKAKSGDEAAKTFLRERVRAHILEQSAALRGQLVDWDVLNEPYTNHDLMDVLGRDAMVDWFQIAKAGNTGARLFINDYPGLDPGDGNNIHQNDFYKNIEFLIERGAPVEGIGLQGHIGWNVTPPEATLRGLDRFAEFKLPLQITEFDVDVTDEALQADYSRDFYTAAFSHPAVSSILTWGFWEGAHWKPDAALYRKNWEMKPNGAALLKLIKETWWTNAQGQSSAKGEFGARGFLGDYEITVSKNGQSQKMQTNLTREGQTVSIALPEGQ